MAYTDTETQDTFCRYTDVKFSSALPRERWGSFKSNELSLYPKHHHNHRAFRHLHPQLSLQSVTPAVHPQFQSGVKVYINVYAHISIYGYTCVYINSNNILFCRLPNVKLQNSIVLQLNL